MLFNVGKSRKKKEQEDATPANIVEKLKKQMDHLTAFRHEILVFLRLYEQFLRKIAAVEDPHESLSKLMAGYANDIWSVEPGAARQFQETADEIMTLSKCYKDFCRNTKVQTVDKLRFWCEHRDGGYQQLKREANALKQAHDRLGQMRKKCCWQTRITKSKRALKAEYRQKLNRFQLHLDRCYNSMDYALNALFIDLMRQHRDFCARVTKSVDQGNSMPTIPTI